MRKFRLNCLSALRVVIVQATALPQRAAGAPAPQEGWDVAVYPILVWVPLGIPPPCRGRTPQRLASYHGRRGAAAVDQPVERYNAPGGPAGTHALSRNVYTAFAWPLRGRDSASLESMCSTLDGARGARHARSARRLVRCGETPARYIRAQRGGSSVRGVTPAAAPYVRPCVAVKPLGPCPSELSFIRQTAHMRSWIPAQYSRLAIHIVSAAQGALCCRVERRCKVFSARRMWG